ncbi:MAG: hypothetical protein LBS68_03035 [Puniceicoccales bacterium]|jgi:hypothetical protein|nr:hypothetical protein [Puniceicoccales bacterium]
MCSVGGLSSSSYTRPPNPSTETEKKPEPEKKEEVKKKQTSGPEAEKEKKETHMVRNLLLIGGCTGMAVLSIFFPPAAIGFAAMSLFLKGPEDGVDRSEINPQGSFLAPGETPTPPPDRKKKEKKEEEEAHPVLPLDEENLASELNPLTGEEDDRTTPDNDEVGGATTDHPATLPDASPPAVPGDGLPDATV